MKTNEGNVARLQWLASISLCLLLFLAGCRSTGEEKRPAAAPLTDIEWQWIETVEQDDGRITTNSNPEKYTLVFRRDGTYHGKADCNIIGGRYTQENGFRIMPGPSTMAYCGEDALDRKYLEGLGRATAAKIDDSGHLALESDGNTARMRYRNGGVAP